ncbi:MAG: helix-turn-helix transcriptional regulator, partial [Solirubrobacteraceae bacterium]
AYRARDATETRRLVEPHSLVTIGRRWYLVAWDCDREAWRTFRVDRLLRPSPAGGRFVARKLPGGDPAAYVSANLSAAPYRYQARVTLHAPAKELTARHRHIWGTVEPVDEQRCEYRTSDDSLDWLAMRIGMLGVEFEVHEPPELVERFEALAERFARAGG